MFYQKKTKNNPQKNGKFPTKIAPDLRVRERTFGVVDGEKEKKS